ncbi:hypothetical protein DPMN_087274 [Dreissena polymorpha]|uniref:Uncharacterized protein n=1 Tax=Dreissena polymorpha TaxID=45954 RepID=A0A9D4KSH5_DREPO|nr:hypothetical protein DPMN_087274 [Dreissena polymorpha]
MVSCYTACTTGLTRLSAQHSDTSKHIRLSSTHGSDVVIVHGFYNRRPYPDAKRNIPTHDAGRIQGGGVLPRKRRTFFAPRITRLRVFLPRGHTSSIVRINI